MTIRHEIAAAWRALRIPLTLFALALFLFCVWFVWTSPATTVCEAEPHTGAEWCR